MKTWDPEQVREACRAHGVQWEDNKPMALLTTYAVGGTARLAVTVRTSDDMQRLATALSECEDIPLVVLGRGSNTLFADAGFDGVVVIVGSSEESKSITCAGDVVSAAGAMLMPVLARRSVQAGRGGLEWCVGIPGTVGGAVRMNAGGHGAEMDDSLLSARVLSLRSGTTHVVPKSALGLHFRGSALSAHHIVMSAEFSTSAQDVQKGTAELDNIVAWRREHQPGGRNAGSVFVNPAPGSGSAGALIDAAGLRGFTSGGAHVSEKHANFIQATETATASDIIAVMDHVQNVVREQTGTVLRSEVRLVGFSDNIAQQFADAQHDAPQFVAARQSLCSLLGEM